MKINMLKMNALMSVTIGFFMSLAGNLSSGKFNPVTFLITFLASMVISFLIGLVVPMKKIEEGLAEKLGLEQHSLKEKLVSTAVSDLIYTPIMTFAMTSIVRKIAFSHGAKGLPPFPIMYVKSLVLGLAVCFVIIFIARPIFLKMVMKNAGERPQDRPNK